MNEIKQIWLQYRSSLKAFLHSKVANAAEVDDLLQEILIKTHQKLPTVKDSTSIKSWLFQIANNTIIDLYRKRAASETIETNELWYASEDTTIQDELAQCVEPFIRALPEESTQLLTAIDIEGQSQKEYANKIGVSYSTLKSRVQKSRAELRRVFDQCCEFKLDHSGRLMEYIPRPNNCEDC